MTADLAENPTWSCVVAVALERADGRWLMHQRPLEKHHGGQWEFPGGKVEDGEVPVIALVREAREELGIDLDTAALVPCGFAQSSCETPAPQIVILLYRTTIWQGEPRAIEGEAVRWCTPHEIGALDRPPLDVALCEGLFGKCAQ